MANKKVFTDESLATLVDETVSYINNETSKKARRISLKGQCQTTSYRTSVIALCKAPTNTSCGGANNSYSSGQLNFHRNNGLYAPVIAIVGMGASHGAINRVMARYLCSSDFSIFKPCTFTYNGVSYGGIEVKTSDAEAHNVTFVGETTFDIFGLDIYDSNQKLVLNEEVYNSISYDNVIIKSGWKDSTYSLITSENIASQSVASATKDGNGKVISSTYETKTDASNKLTEAKTYTDSVASGKANTSHAHSISDVTNLQTSLNSKQSTITGGATTIASSNLTANRALISNSSGKVTVSDVTSAELKHLDGVTSNIQEQLDGKSSSSHTHNYAGSSSAGGAATSANKLNTDAGSATQPVYFSSGVPKNTTYTLGKSVPSNAVFTDAHYASKNVVGTTNATSNTATALTNGNVYLNSVENGAVTSSHKISGSGATTVTTDASSAANTGGSGSLTSNAASSSTTSSNGSSSQSLLQPYIVVYRWVRTA